MNKAVQEAVNSFLQIFNILYPSLVIYPSLVKKLRYVIIKQKLRRLKLSSYGHVTNRDKSCQIVTMD